MRSIMRVSSFLLFFGKCVSEVFIGWYYSEKRQVHNSLFVLHGFICGIAALFGVVGVFFCKEDVVKFYAVMFFMQILAFCFSFWRPGRFIGESVNFASN